MKNKKFNKTSNDKYFVASNESNFKQDDDVDQSFYSRNGMLPELLLTSF